MNGMNFIKERKKMTNDIKTPKILVVLEGTCDKIYAVSRNGGFTREDVKDVEERILEASSLLRQIKAEVQVSS